MFTLIVHSTRGTRYILWSAHEVKGEDQVPPRPGGEGSGRSHPCRVRPPPSSACGLRPRGHPQRQGVCQISSVRAAALSLSSPPHTENRHSGKDPLFSANCLFAQSFLSENTHAGVAALSSHGGHDLPAVNDGVVALNAAQQGVPVVAEGEGPAGIEKGAPPPAPPTGLAPSPAPPRPRPGPVSIGSAPPPPHKAPPTACLNRLRPTSPHKAPPPHTAPH